MTDLALVSNGTEFCPECERNARFWVHGRMKILTWKDCPPATIYALVLHCDYCGKAVEHRLLAAASQENAKRLGEAFAARDRLRAAARSVLAAQGTSGVDDAIAALRVALEGQS